MKWNKSKAHILSKSVIEVNGRFYRVSTGTDRNLCRKCYFDVEYAPISCNKVSWFEPLGSIPVDEYTGSSFTLCLPNILGININNRIGRSLFLVSCHKKYLYENN